MSFSTFIIWQKIDILDAGSEWTSLSCIDPNDNNIYKVNDETEEPKKNCEVHLREWTTKEHQ